MDSVAVAPGEELLVDAMVPPVARTVMRAIVEVALLLVATALTEDLHLCSGSRGKSHLHSHNRLCQGISVTLRETRSKRTRDLPFVGVVLSAEGHNKGSDRNVHRIK